MSKVLIWSLFIIIIVIASIILFNLPYWLLLIIAVIPIIEDLMKKLKN
jgi:hypothetical protein